MLFQQEYHGCQTAVQEGYKETYPYQRARELLTHRNQMRQQTQWGANTHGYGTKDLIRDTGSGDKRNERAMRLPQFTDEELRKVSIYVQQLD